MRSTEERTCTKFEDFILRSILSASGGKKDSWYTICRSIASFVKRRTQLIWTACLINCKSMKIHSVFASVDPRQVRHFTCRVIDPTQMIPEWSQQPGERAATNNGCWSVRKVAHKIIFDVLILRPMMVCRPQSKTGIPLGPQR